MRLYIFNLFLFTSSVFGFTLDQVMERVDHLEERVNKENKFRRDGFKMLMNEIGSIKTMLQQALGNKVETKYAENVQDTKFTNSELEEKVLLLTNAFMKEKMLNKRIRREIPELQKRVHDLNTKSDKLSTGIEDTLVGIEFIKNQNRDTFIMLEDEIPKIKGYALNLLEQIEQTEITEAENFGKIKDDTEEIKNDIEHLKRSEDQCSENIKINNNLTKRLEEQLSGKVFTKAEHDSTRSEVYEKECNCSISSCPVNSAPSNTPMPSYKSCLELYESGFKSNAIYTIEIEKERNISVYCDMTTDCGGWTVFQRRKDGSVDFDRNWDDYETGFGNTTGEFWLGNKYLNLLTDNEGGSHELRIDLEDHEGNRAYAKYSSFKVGQNISNYKLYLSGYTGNAGDSLTVSGSHDHDQMEFSTRDADNDKYKGIHCAKHWKGGWWFNACFEAHLNGLYRELPKCKSKWMCIIWYTWKGAEYALKFTEMKLR